MNTSNSAWKAFYARPGCLLTELDDGTGVVLDVSSKYYHTLNTTAVVLWKALASRAHTSAELVVHLVEQFDVADGEAARDVSALLAHLLSESLIAESTTP